MYLPHTPACLQRSVLFARCSERRVAWRDRRHHGVCRCVRRKFITKSLSLFFLFSSVLIIPPLHSLVLPTSEQTVGVINVAIVASAHTLRRALAGMCGDDGHAAIVCGLTQYIYIVLSLEKNIGIIFTRSTFTCCANGHIIAQSSCTSSDNQVDLLQSSARHFLGGI